MNQNKMDKQPVTGKRGVERRADEKKRRGLYLLVDALLLCGVIAVAFFMVLAFTPLSLFGQDTESREIIYTIEFSGVDKEYVSAFHVGDTVVDSQTDIAIGVIEAVETRDYEAYLEIPEPQIDPEIGKHKVQKAGNEEWKTVTLTVRVTADYEQDVGYSVQNCRIAVGREYHLRFTNYTNEGVCLNVAYAAENGEVNN